MGFTSILRLAITTFFGKTKAELVRVIDVLRKKYIALSDSHDELLKKNSELQEEIEGLKAEMAKAKITKVNRVSNKPSSKKSDWELDGVGNDGKGKKKGRGKKGRKGSGSKPKNKSVTRKEENDVEQML